MAKEVLELQVDSNIKQVTKDQKEWNKEIKKTKDNIEDVNEEGKEVVAEMQLLGFSINGLKSAWSSAAAGAKFLFRSIKAGIISTGVGAFVVALGSVAAWFTQTKQGAEFLERALAGLGAGFKVLIDRVAKFGGGVKKLFTGEVMAGLLEMGFAFRKIGDEIQNDIALTVAFKKSQQELADSQREVNVETAKQRAEVERLKLIAEDVTKSTSVRLKAAQDAFNIENKLLDKRIGNAKEDLRLQRELMKTTAVNKKNTAEELDREAQLQIDLFNIVQESTTKQIELNNKINAIKQEQAAKDAEAIEARQQEILTIPSTFEKWKKKQVDTAKDTAEIIKAVDQDLVDTLYDNAVKNTKTRTDLAKLEEELKVEYAQQGLEAVKQIAGEGTALAKAAAIAQVTISGIQGVQNAFTSNAANAPATVASAGAFPFIQAGLAATFAGIQIAAIMSQKKPTAGGGGMGGGGDTRPPAPQMMSGAFELGGGVAPEPLKAFVVTDEMTNSQDQLANIRRRATI